MWGLSVDGDVCGCGIRRGIAWWVESCRGSESETETETETESETETEAIDGCVARSHSRTHCVRTMILMIL